MLIGEGAVPVESCEMPVPRGEVAVLETGGREMPGAVDDAVESKSRFKGSK